MTPTPLPADTACSEAQQESGSARLSNRRRIPGFPIARTAKPKGSFEMRYGRLEMVK
jgi:hypothetical protein